MSERHEEMRKIVDQDAAVQQAKQWAQEARTRGAIIQEICGLFGLRCGDWEAVEKIREALAAASPEPSDDVKAAAGKLARRCSLAPHEPEESRRDAIAHTIEACIAARLRDKLLLLDMTTAALRRIDTDRCDAQYVAHAAIAELDSHIGDTGKSPDTPKNPTRDDVDRAIVKAYRHPLVIDYTEDKSSEDGIYEYSLALREILGLEMCDDCAGLLPNHNGPCTGDTGTETEAGDGRQE